LNYGNSNICDFRFSIAELQTVDAAICRAASDCRDRTAASVLNRINEV
jgi:hypothetical protein